VKLKKAIKNISKIAEVEGIDGIFLGPSDLSASIGKIGQFEDDEVQSLIAEGLEYCKKVKTSWYFNCQKRLCQKVRVGWIHICSH